MILKRYIGDKRFYRRVLALTLPIMIQNGITNFVNMLDNVMVGRIGTADMTGVAVANQLLFVFNLCVFGAVSGAGIFGAQFYGNGDTKGLRDTFRFKILFCTLMSVMGIAILYYFDVPLINMYLSGEGDPADAARSLSVGVEYLHIMLIGLVPYTVVQCYSSSLRETGETLLPMYGGMIAVILNLVLNYILIFGNFGAPELGVAGAAIATVISRFAELFVVVTWSHINKAKHKFLVGAYKRFTIPLRLIGQITLKGMPLMANEALWAAGMATLNQRYSVISLDVVAANNISQTFLNVFSVVFMSVGAAIGIILGQRLGAGDNEGARDSARKLIAFSVLSSCDVAAVYSIFAVFIPLAYETTDSVRDMATKLMWISAAIMPIEAFVNASYFTLRSGGKVIVTFLFDSCFVWCLSVPVAFILTSFTSLNVFWVFAICRGLDIIKCIIGYCLVKKGIWIKNIVK